MHKEKFDIKAIMIQWFVSHPWLKLIALILAIMVWLYAKEEIKRLTLF